MPQPGRAPLPSNIQKLLDEAGKLVDDLKHDPISQRPDAAATIRATEEVFATVGTDIAAAVRAINAPLPGAIPDLPDSCLVGRLGEWTDRELSDFPRAYSWPSMLTVASGFLDDQPTEPLRANLYTALVGPVHSGKSQAISRAITILGLDKPQLLRLYAGSMEQLARKLNDGMGNPRVLVLDELLHLFRKAHIERSSFEPILCNAFDSGEISLMLGRKVTDHATIACRLSLLGGIVDDMFQDAFGRETTGGLYDRFLFGLCPGNFEYCYSPFIAPVHRVEIRPVKIDRSVWDEKNQFLANWNARRRSDPTTPDIRRVLEIALRAAVVCAAFNGNAVLKGFQLGPFFQLVEYQAALRVILVPNRGETVEGRLTLKMIAYLKSYGGKFVSRRELLRATHAYEVGVSIADRILSVLKAQGDIQIQKIGRETVVRWVFPDEAEPEETEC